ncbi:hypothetical protein ZIOFF_036394 [Zingiber officinale]|uniref:GATA-type domain-containing protein n=1 Tax=Zingiber officinale TaxID=94328 RepID=A0A8J5KYJ9_ZINOF|nr:hypothetical protein ZIOFF_036394 [Zingiber officinale]
MESDIIENAPIYRPQWPRIAEGEEETMEMLMGMDMKPLPDSMVPNSKRCVACLQTDTPLWRNGPDGPKTLCNACGLKFRKEAMKVDTKLTLGPPDYIVKFSGRGRGDKQQPPPAE